MSYEIIDTIIIPNAGRTDSIRISKTLNDNKDPATMWVFPSGRFTYFGEDHHECREINQFVAGLVGDGNSIEEMNLFTDKNN